MIVYYYTPDGIISFTPRGVLGSSVGYLAVSLIIYTNRKDVIYVPPPPQHMPKVVGYIDAIIFFLTLSLYLVD